MKTRGFKRNLKKVALLFLIGFCTISCSSDDESSPGGPDETETAISGKLMAPDQKTPIAGALVYVASEAQGKSANNSMDNADCSGPLVENLGYACTDAEGNFYFTVAATNDIKKLYFVAGAFEFNKDVELTGGKTIDFKEVYMPVNSAKIVVVRGSYDRMEDVLAKLGYADIGPDGLMVPGSESFDLLDSTAPLFEDGDGDGKKDIFNYDMVFVNCGTSETPLAGRNASGVHLHKKENTGSAVLSGENKEAIKTFVEQGGTLYATDWSYDYVEQVFPSFVDFLGSDPTPADQAEEGNVAQTGNGGLNVEASVLKSTMASWFPFVTCDNGSQCLNPNGSISITDFLYAWAVMEKVNPDVTVWIEGEVEYGSEKSVKPLTVSFEVGNGTVIYSSYHTIESVHSEFWRPQERVLQYLVFE